MQETQTDSYPIKNLSTTEKFSIPTPIEELKPVVFVRYEFECRGKLKFGYFLWKFRTIRTLMQEKNNDF